MDAAKTGKLIRELRTEKGLTQQELASQLNVSPTAVSKWENGRRLPDVSLFEPLAKALGVSLAELILGEKVSCGEEGQTEGKAEGNGSEKLQEELAEAAIRSVIEESALLQCEKGRRRVRTASLVMLLLAALLLLVGWWAGTHVQPWVRDLSRLERVEPASPEDAFMLGGKRYVPYGEMNSGRFDLITKRREDVSSGSGTFGSVAAYRLSPDGSQCSYFITVKILSGDWLLMFEDNGQNVFPAAQTAQYLYGTQQSIDNAPAWLISGW